MFSLLMMVLTILLTRFPRGVSTDEDTRLLKYGFYNFPFIVLQGIGRFLGLLDFLRGRKDILWQIAEMTKDPKLIPLPDN